MAGTAHGLQALVDDTNPLFVRDDSPSGESRYHVRFYLDANGFDPGEADTHFRIRVLIAHDQDDQRAITIVLKRQSGAYSLEVLVQRDDGTRADSGFFAISDAPHFVELDWQRATAPGANDGTCAFYIDNVIQTTLTGLDTDLTTIEYVRMGAMSVKSAAAGTLYFDQFEARRDRIIGPE